MDSLSLGLILAAVIGGFIALYLALRRKPEPPVPVRDDSQSFMLLQNQVGELTRALDAKLAHVTEQSRHAVGETTRQMERQSSESLRAIRDVTERLTKLDETNRQVVGFADQLKNLQDILKNPKQRGILGEYYLEAVLKNVLPPGSYQMQYGFKDGVIVDAAVFVDKRVIPIDSKFSLENYNRILESPLESPERKRYESAFIADLKLRIDETSKYVKPEENTMDFAFMFIPSEAVYYDLLINKVGAVADDTKSLVTYAGAKRVIIVSPTSFLAYLQTVLQGLRNQKISEQAKEITKHVENLGKHLGAYEDYMKKLGKNLDAATSSYTHAYKEFAKVDKDVLKITGEAIGVEVQQLEGPRTDEEVAPEKTINGGSSRLL